MNCKICDEKILINSDIVIFVDNIKATGEDGEFDIVCDFFKKKQIFHRHCYLANFTSPNNKLDNEIIKEIKKLDPKAQIKDIVSFLSDKKGMSTASVILLWLKNREKFV